MGKPDRLSDALIKETLSSPAVFLFAVFASVDLIFFVSEIKDMIQFLLDGCDTSRILAADHIPDLFWEFQLFLFNDLFILNDIYRDIVIDKSKDVQIHKVDRTLDLDDVFPAHLAALCVLYDSNTAVKLVQVEIFVNIHALSCLDVVQDKAFRYTSYIQCTFYPLSVPLFLKIHFTASSV